MEENKWIPCSKKMPEKDGLYLVWTQGGCDDEPTYEILGYDVCAEAFGVWHDRYHPVTYGFVDSDFEEIECIAWMELPEPYREDIENESALL